MISTVTVPSGRYKTGDVVWTHYWYTDNLCRVTIKGAQQGKILVSHDIEEDPYFGAPDERISVSQILAKVSPDWHGSVVPEGAEEVVEPGAGQLPEAGGAEEDEVEEAEEQGVDDVEPDGVEPAAAAAQ